MLLFRLNIYVLYSFTHTFSTFYIGLHFAHTVAWVNLLSSSHPIHIYTCDFLPERSIDYISIIIVPLTSAPRCAHVGPEPLPSWSQVVQAVHPGHAEDGRQRAADVSLQTQARQGLVALPRQERRRRGDGTDGKQRSAPLTGRFVCYKPAEILTLLAYHTAPCEKQV